MKSTFERRKEGNYPTESLLRNQKYWHNTYIGRNINFIYPEFLLFFKNVRYLIPLRGYKSIAAFDRDLRAKCGGRVGCGSGLIQAYEKGHYVIAQYNFLFAVARFLDANVHEMLTISFEERDKKMSGDPGK